MARRRAVEFGDLGAGEAVAVAHHLVDHVGLRRVERVIPPSARTASRRTSGGEPAEELARPRRAGDGAIREAGEGSQPSLDVGELRDPVGRQAEPLTSVEHAGRGVPVPNGPSVAATVAHTPCSTSV